MAAAMARCCGGGRSRHVDGPAVNRFSQPRRPPNGSTGARVSAQNEIHPKRQAPWSAFMPLAIGEQLVSVGPLRVVPVLDFQP
jgi:hypothetical protein